MTINVNTPLRPLGQARAVVSGGASGLGWATAQAIVDAGGRVALLDLNREAGEQAARKLGASALFVVADVADETSVNHAIERAQSFLGTINLAVSCAGVAPSQRVLGRDGLLSTTEFNRTVQINLTGTFNLNRAAAERMQQNPEGGDGERGVIINTASIAAFDGQIGQAAYAAAKGAIVSMTLPLAREFARFGIRVVTIAPGLFRTPLFDRLPPKAVSALEEATPFPKRLGHPEEFAALACHIFQNGMINGETLRLDGALRMV